MKTKFFHINILLSLLVLTSCGEEKSAPSENTEVHKGDIELTQQQFEQGNMQLDHRLIVIVQIFEII